MKMKLKVTKLILIAAFALIGSASAFAQKDCGPKYGLDSALGQKNLGMFNQYFKQKDYVQAYDYWVYLFNNAPCASKRITFNGAFIAKNYLVHLQKTDTAAFNARKDGLIDTILLTYDKRIKHWGGEWDVRAKQAVDMYKLRPDLRDSAMKLYAMSVEKLGNSTNYKTAVYYMQAAISEHKYKRYTLDSLYDLYFQLQDISTYNIKNQTKPKEIKKWNIVDTSLTKMMRPYFTCEKIEEFFKAQTDAAPNDIALLKKVSGLLESAKCNSSDYALDVAIKLYELEPSSESAVVIGKTYQAKEQNDKAIEWYVKGVDGIADSTEREQLYQRMAAIEYAAGKVSNAKNYAQKAVAINPNNGAAHLIIAGCYAKSRGACSSDGIDGLSVYWAAYDRALKAKTVAPSVTEQANKLMNSYAASFVKSEDAFFKSFPVAEGGTYTVPCLGVPTTVRFRK